MDSSRTSSELKENIVLQNLEDDFPIEEDDIIPKFKGSKDKPMVYWII